jgi:nucleotide-binding universal stress UspA family protein
MIEIKRILCPVDFSDYSRQALHYAGSIAKWYESSVTVLYVHPAVPVAAAAPGAPAFPPFAVTASDRDKLLTSMKSFVEHETHSVAPIDYRVVEGPVGPEILDVARGVSADLIVMGTHGRSGFERLMVGSVTERILRKASCPVLSVPPAVQGEHPSAIFKKMLCAIDFSEWSMRALDYAISLAQEADAHLTVLHVVELPADAQERLPHLSPGVREYVAAVEDDHRVRLQAAVPESVRAVCEVETMMAVGKPYREVLRVAAEQHSDLIVIGVHGRGAADLLLFGSTTQHVVRQATCPVLTLRQ